ncbi:hypothetical protein PG987_005784 [Apiospora arundinis]
MSQPTGSSVGNSAEARRPHDAYFQNEIFFLVALQEFHEPTRPQFRRPQRELREPYDFLMERRDREDYQRRVHAFFEEQSQLESPRLASLEQRQREANVWNHEYDPAPARHEIPSDLVKPCAACKGLLYPGVSVRFLPLKTAAKACLLCRMLLERIGNLDENDSAIIKNTKGVIHVYDNEIAISRIYNYPGNMIAPPRIPDNYRDRELPGRLLNVSPTKDRNIIRLDIARRIKEKPYLALSHCWGQLIGDQNRQWCTLPHNVASRMKGFYLSELPRTFQEAIEVTRALQVPYLWIDSICIIQGDDADWRRESKLMENVYASAYCTIAATAANDSTTGFLSVGEHNQSLLVAAGGYGPRLFVEADEVEAIYVSTNVADFDEDVNRASLNNRAWVMQERFLSPRTIHFTRTQVYGECGQGIYAGDNIHLRSNEQTIKSFQLDPAFPQRLLMSGNGPTWDFLQSMLENYCQRGITNLSDRAIAISGLLYRIEKVLQPCHIYHGIIEWYLHRTLLWRRKKGHTSMGKIEYQSPVPSWSWMAYAAPVVFTNDSFGKHDAIKGLQFNKTTVEAHVWEITNPGIKCRPIEDANVEYQFQLQDSNGLNIGFITIDQENVDELRAGLGQETAKSF